jgi:FkbH-like protein
MPQAHNIVVTASFTAELIAEPLAFWTEKMGWPVQLTFAPYNQVFQQLLDPGSLAAGNGSGLNVFLVRIPDLHATGGSDSGSSSQGVQDLVLAFRSFRSRSTAPCVLLFCPDNDPVADAAEQSIACELAFMGGLRIVTSSELLSFYPVEELYDPEAEQLGRIPYTAAGFAALGTMVARCYYGLRQSPYKVIAVDCDEVLWGGICGEVGPDGIVIDSPRRHLQEFLVAQHDSGVLLCLCSKNNQQDVWDVFNRHPEMPLRREHLVDSRINWQPKSENLKSLARALNLGLDSFVFIDDNPLECADVDSNCPGVLTLQLPAADSIPTFLCHIWALDRRATTDEDRKRTELYRQDAERNRLRESSLSFEGFLSSLQLKVRIDPVRPEELARAAQLTQRTNQFNCTTLRYSEDELRLQTEAECLVVEVSDRFGNYGLVGVAMVRPNTEALQVENLLLSCRVLGRGVEHQVLSFLQRQARTSGLNYVDVHFRLTAKNQPARDFLEKNRAEILACGDERETVFRFSADAEIKLAAEPQLRSATHLESPRIAANAAGNSHVIEIATELRDVESILRAMRTMRMRMGSVLPSSERAQSPVEQTIAEIWSEVLGVQAIGIRANFFTDLGGDSLSGTRVISRMRHIYKLPLELRLLFEAPTIAQLAMEVVQQLAGTVQDPELAGILDELQTGERKPIASVSDSVSGQA